MITSDEIKLCHVPIINFLINVSSMAVSPCLRTLPPGTYGCSVLAAKQSNWIYFDSTVMPILTDHETHKYSMNSTFSYELFLTDLEIVRMLGHSFCIWSFWIYQLDDCFRERDLCRCCGRRVWGLLSIFHLIRLSWSAENETNPVCVIYSQSQIVANNRVQNLLVCRR